MLRAESVSFAYGETNVLSDVSAEFEEAEIVALVGPSGCGKTTLLYCLSGLISPKDGKITFNGDNLTTQGEEARAALRRKSFGFVFQSAELVPELTIRENISLPLELQRFGRKERSKTVDSLVERLGLGQHADRRAAHLSGGQRQRAAVARAVVHRPAVVFADEPTGALDTSNSAAVMELIFELSREQGSTVVLVTHDISLAEKADRSVALLDGRLRPPAGETQGDGGFVR
jgi:putative ABC transport system ATP-binding protein